MSYYGLKLKPRLMQAILGTVFATCILAPHLALAQLSTQQNNEGLDVIPLNITNNVISTPPLFVYIVGILPKNSISYRQGQWLYVTDIQGNVSITPSIPATAPISLGVNVGSGVSAPMMLPKLDAMRIYFSFGNGLLVQTNSQQGAPPSAPCGWCGTGNTENANNFNTIYDWAELAWTDDGSVATMGGNVTQVDQFGMPLLLRLYGTDPTNNQPTMVDAGFTDRRPPIMNAYASFGPPWNTLVLSNGGGARMRVVAPYHGIEMGVFPSNALQPYVDQVWSTYTSQQMMVTHVCKQDGSKPHTFIGQVSGGNLVFTDTINPMLQFQFPKPDTLTVYRNEIHASPTPSNELTLCLAKGVAAKLGGALVRTNLLVNSNLDACQLHQFYVNNPIQSYAQLFHQFGINGLAYSFGYDDTCSQSSYITVDSPTAVSIGIAGPP
jgi:hypothetical protein